MIICKYSRWTQQHIRSQSLLQCTVWLCFLCFNQKQRSGQGFTNKPMTFSTGTWGNIVRLFTCISNRFSLKLKYLVSQVLVEKVITFQSYLSSDTARRMPTHAQYHHNQMPIANKLVNSKCTNTLMHHKYFFINPVQGSLISLPAPLLQGTRSVPGVVSFQVPAVVLLPNPKPYPSECSLLHFREPRVRYNPNWKSTRLLRPPG